MTRRPIRLAATAAVAALLLAACGQASGPAADGERTRSPKPTPTATQAGPGPSDSATAEQPTAASPRVTVQQAVDTTRDAGSAKVDVEAEVAIGGATTRITGEGALDFAAGTGELEFTFDDGSVVRQIVTIDAVYVQLPGEPDTWYEAPLDETGLTPLGTGDPSAVLGALRKAGEVTEDGTEEIDGAETTRYVGTVDVTEVLAASGLSGEQVDRLGTLLDGATATVTAWVDGKDRVVQMQQDFVLPAGDLGEVTSSSLVRFSDFGVAVDVLPPPGDQIEPAPEGLFGSPA